jgi:hypothetical protein
MTIAIPIPMILLSRMLYPSGGKPSQRHNFLLKLSFPFDTFERESEREREREKERERERERKRERKRERER